jgi:4-hydroxybenzoate polyprenyltransferase
MRLDKPIGIYLLLWPALIGLWIAGDGAPQPLHIAVFVLGVILTRSAGCVINDFADRDFDPHVSRTNTRPLAQREIPPHHALILFVVLLLMALGLVLCTNNLTILLAVIAVGLMSAYPFVKRISNMPQLILGIAFSWAIPMAFAAETGIVPLASLTIMFATISWTVGYDTMYALVDREDDIKIGVKSSAILFGRFVRQWIAAWMLLTLALMIAAGWLFDLGYLYGIGLAIATTHGIVNHRRLHHDDVQQAFIAFRHTHYQGLIVWLFTIISLINK